MLELFHFLRPLWLAAVPLVVAVWWAVRRRDTTGAIGLDELVAPHLRDALVVGRQGRPRVLPVDALAVGLACLVVAAAGPSWSREPSPWFSETAPLVVALEVSRSMRSNDVQPTRLDRARFAILDLLAQRGGARTALIAYAKTAHLVLPPTTDAEVVKLFLEGLDPEVMPADGANASAVVATTRQVLGDQAAGATLLFVGDGFEAVDAPAIAELGGAENGPGVVALVFGTAEGGVALAADGSYESDVETKVDESTLDKVAGDSGMTVVRATVDDSDIRQLLRHIESRVAQAAADDPDLQWKDQGWWFVWPAAAIGAVWFRRGWTMRW